MAETIDWPSPRRPRRRGRLLILAVLAVVVLGAGTALSYYVEALWFDSLGYVDVFWKTLNVQASVFIGFAAITLVVTRNLDLHRAQGGLVMNDVIGLRRVVAGLG